MPLAFGGCAVIAPSLLALCANDAGRLYDEVTVLNGTPSGVQMLLETGRLPKHVRLVRLGGEVLTRRLVDRLFDSMHTGGRVINEYGPTEATDLCLFEEMRRGDSSAPLVGRAVPGIQIHVLDAVGLS